MHGIFYFVFSICTVGNDFQVYTDLFVLLCACFCSRVVRQVGKWSMKFVGATNCKAAELKRCEFVMFNVIGVGVRNEILLFLLALWRYT